MNPAPPTRSPRNRIDVDEAAQLVIEAMPQFGSERVELTAATGRILREDVYAERDQPPFDRATMDGIAVNSAALDDPAQPFRCHGIQAAGMPPGQLEGIRDCLEIMTGAVLPAGADTVIPVERINWQTDQQQCTLESGYTAAPGQFVHRRGSDRRQGEQLLAAGTRIRGPEMAILTAAGSKWTHVARQPAVAVISTGDELVDIGQPLADHQIRSSNDRAIEASLQLRGAAVVTRSHLPDQLEQLTRAISRLHAEHEVLVLSGGVSMGKYDYIPRVLETLGVQLIFHKVLQRPGLPMWFGLSGDNKPVFALPGNPVSTLVCLHRYVLPALAHAQGDNAALQTDYAALATAIEFKPDLCWLLPVQLRTDTSGMAQAWPCPTNTSGDFTGLRGTHGFIQLPRGRAQFPAGCSAPFYPW